MKSPRRTCPPPILVVSSPTTPTCSKQQYHSNKARSREQIKLHNIASRPFCQPSTSRTTRPYSCASPYMAMNVHHPAMGLMVSLGQSTDYSGSKGVLPAATLGEPRSLWCFERYIRDGAPDSVQGRITHGCKLGFSVTLFEVW
jgi:hypothetical protein